MIFPIISVSKIRLDVMLILKSFLHNITKAKDDDKFIRVHLILTETIVEYTFIKCDRITYKKPKNSTHFAGECFTDVIFCYTLYAFFNHLVHNRFVSYSIAKHTTVFAWLLQWIYYYSNAEHYCTKMELLANKITPRKNRIRHESLHHYIFLGWLYYFS